MKKDKIETLLGFALRAGKIKFGADSTDAGKRAYVTVVCGTLSPGTLDKVLKNCGEKAVPVLQTDKPLQDIVHRNNCKVVSVTDRQMAEAVLNEISENYRLLVTGGNRIDNDQ